MKQFIILSLLFVPFFSFGQKTDSSKGNKVVVFKDYRLDILGQKEAEINKQKALSAQGFRLMILNTSDKNYAFKVRAELLQRFPEQKLYMWFANPYIRIKLGNFITKEEAEPYQKEISKMLDGATIYLIPETIEVDPGKDFDPDKMR
jgi:hypothetical protein